MHRLILGLLCLGLSGCFGAGGRAAVVANYDFGPPPAGQSGTLRQLPLAVEVRVPAWLDGLGINYRLAYVEPARLHEYAQARWVGPPAQLIQQRLVRDLGLTVPWQGGIGCGLRLEISEFSQNYSDPEHSQGVLQGRVSLLGRSRQVLAELPVAITRPAAAQDALGGVAALSAAVGQLVLDLQAWEARLAAGGTAAACFR